LRLGLRLRGAGLGIRLHWWLRSAASVFGAFAFQQLVVAEQFVIIEQLVIVEWFVVVQQFVVQFVLKQLIVFEQFIVVQQLVVQYIVISKQFVVVQQ
jgi:hypothetical protein